MPPVATATSPTLSSRAQAAARMPLMDLTSLLPQAPSARLALEASLTRALEVIARQQARIMALESEAQTDAMTGVLNRRGFMKALSREVERARRQQATSAILVLFDLDGLKQVNDTYGHGAGDAYIKALADGLSTVRATDYVGRLGGDEFALLLTDAEPAAARRRVTQLLATLARTAVRHDGSCFALAASHGCTNVVPTVPPETLLALADMELYREKAQRKARMAEPV